MTTPPRFTARTVVYLCAAVGALWGCKPTSATPPTTGQPPAPAGQLSPATSQPATPKVQYTLPDKLAMNVNAERVPLGGISIQGNTNLPEGTILGVDLSKRSSKRLGQAKVMVRDGKFSSEPFTNEGDPWAAGTYSVKLYAYFNGPWRQPQNVMEAFGDHGASVRERRDPLLERLDPDLKDSEVIFAFTSNVVFPELSPEDKAVLLVKRSTHAKKCGYRRTVPVGEWAEQLRVQMHLIGTWEAKPSTSGTTYDVVYRYRNVNPPAEFSAEWTADLKTSQVKMQNREAKNFSCIDADD